MVMRKTLVLAAVLAFTGSAYAADLPSKAPSMVAPAAPSWTGWYVGVNGGGVWGRTSPGLAVNNINFFNPVNIPAVIQNASGTIDNSGGLAGGQIGYLLQSGQVVFGVEAGFDWMDARGSRTAGALYIAANPNPGYTINQSVSSEWLLTLLGRVGVDMGAWYPYITGGIAVADLKYNWNYTDTFWGAGCACAASFSKTVLGGVGGVGVEWRWDSHWSLRGEYLLMYFDSVTGTSHVGNPTFGTLAIYAHQAQFQENIGRLALSYKFGP